MTAPTDNGTGPVVAAILYARGVVHVADAVELAVLSEARFAELINSVEKFSPNTSLAAGGRGVVIPPEFKLSVLIPVYNEARTIRDIVERVREVNLKKEIIIVDDGSSDGTVEVLKSEIEDQVPDVRVFYSPRNQGKGAAVRRAIKEARGDVCVVQDADLEYDPQEYFQLLEPIIDGRADAVYGTRFMGGGPHRVHLFWHYVGNQILTTISNAFSNLNLTDMETCYKVMRTELAQTLPLRANGLDIEPELTLKLAKAGARIYEVPIPYSGRSLAEGKKTNWKNAFRALFSIIRYRISD